MDGRRNKTDDVPPPRIEGVENKKKERGGEVKSKYDYARLIKECSDIDDRPVSIEQANYVINWFLERGFAIVECLK